MEFSVAHLSSTWNMGTIVISCIIAIVALLSIVSRWNDNRYRSDFATRNIKYVSLGNMFVDLVFRRRIELKKHEAIQRYGPIFGFQMIGRPTVLVAVPELIQQVMAKDFTNFSNRRPFPSKDLVLQNALTLTEGEQWKRLRSVITHAITFGRLRAMKPCIDETVRKLCKNVSNAIEKQSDSIIDIKEYIGSFTMDTIIQIAFGIKIDSVSDPNNPIIEHAKMMFSTNFSFSNLIAFTATFLFPRLAHALDLRPNKVPFNYFHKISLEIIPKKRAEIERRAGTRQVSSEIKATNFIECLLQAGVENDDALDTGKTRQVTNDEIVAQCILFFLIGYDTTASSITMVCYHLVLYPEVQQRLFDEIEKVVSQLRQEANINASVPLEPSQPNGSKLSKISKFDSDNSIELITMESLNRFTYLDAVVNESLRLFAPLKFIERATAVDTRLETADGKYRVDLRRGDIVHVPGYSVHRDPTQFPDPEKFDPERFLKNGDESLAFHKYAFMPFGNGPRSCVAKSLALLETKMAVIHLVRNFRLSRCAQTKVPPELFYQSHFIMPRDAYLRVENRHT